ncbi:putative cation transport regulator-like protein 2 [Amylocarpus encephaloides]|uniref:glutathione-specific gamma-glutamylcyclotransferase n=1 Tax=Amylocarpus encephaloides TaxID=45428 RepID=A0A9P8C9D3_9HELO|nr:putative cation transport regulator-like protein 2 [Amylocarpus encephaloides]
MSSGSGDVQNRDGEFWLFGYGLCRWLRPSVLASHQDHRGTPSSPGRVVTLIERSFWETLDDHHSNDPDKVWGTAYRIEAEKVTQVKDYLDIREINGYTVHYTKFYPADGSSTINTLVYIGTPDNDQFMGPQDPQKLAEHIYRSVGPSGPNIDYLLSLESALDSLSPESGDEHIKDLANRVRAVKDGVDSGQALTRELSRSSGTNDQEETEKQGF